jgi:hypothetical protein
MCACSAQSKQMRRTKDISKRNIKIQKEKQESGKSTDDELDKNDVNYKDLPKIRSQCLYVENGKRCTRKAGNMDYCRKHRKKGGQNIRRRDM